MSEAGKIDFVVCMRAGDGPSYFDDDEFGVCCRCGHAVKFRPSAPKESPKACLQCLDAIIKEGTTHD